MSWAAASDFLAMGGHGVYVWTAYGVTALVLAIEPLLARRRAARALGLAQAAAASDPP